MKIPGVPIKFSETPCAVEKPAPILGQHTDEVLKEFGFDDAKIAELARTCSNLISQSIQLKILLIYRMGTCFPSFFAVY